MKKTLFIVTSLVDTFENSVFNSGIRHSQTINTIQKIYSKIPDAIVVVIEASSGKIHFDNVIMYYPTVDIKNLNKTVGEATILQNFLKSTLYNTLKPNINMCIKLSGRYYLNDKCNIQKYLDYNKINIRKINVLKDPNDPADYINNRSYHNPDASAVVTQFFGFTPSLDNIIYERLSLSIKEFYKNGCDIEQSIFYGLSDEYFNYISYIGVSGYQTGGRFVEY
jgi:hypothetical protein